MGVNHRKEGCAAFEVVIGASLAIRNKTGEEVQGECCSAEKGDFNTSPHCAWQDTNQCKVAQANDKVNLCEVTPEHRFISIGFRSLHAKLPIHWEDLGFGQVNQRRLEELNRYSNVIPTPGTLVTLNRAGVDKIDNYINANFVNGKDYIATQGPLSNTVDDFWLMVWEQEVSVIVMVTGIFEGDKQKCERYWPDGPSSRATTKDGILITMLSTDEHINDKPATYVRSELLLEHEGNSRIVHHFWYNTWPDMDVPIDANGEVQWRAASDMLSTISSEDRKGPWVVHCSAGIGRTGTFIGIDMGQRRLKKEGKVDVLELIRTMRDDRSGMVQTEKQAEFMHRALVGYAEHHIRCS